MLLKLGLVRRRIKTMAKKFVRICVPEEFKNLLKENAIKSGYPSMTRYTEDIIKKLNPIGQMIENNKKKERKRFEIRI